MKKAFVLLMIPLFVITSGGLTFSVHYCGDTAADFSFFGNGSCGCEDSTIPDTCCTDKLHSLKINDHYLSTNFATDFRNFLSEIFPFENPFLVLPKFEFLCSSFCSSDSAYFPPGRFLLYQISSLRI